MVKKLGYVRINYAEITEYLKKKLGTEEEPVEDVPAATIYKEIIETIRSAQAKGQKKQYVFDGILESFDLFHELVMANIGDPSLFVRCQCDDVILRNRYKLKNEIEEISED